MPCNTGDEEFRFLSSVIYSDTISSGNRGKVPISFSRLTLLTMCKNILAHLRTFPPPQKNGMRKVFFLH